LDRPAAWLRSTRGFDLSDAHLRFSPDGRFIAAGISGATGVLGRDGTLLNVLSGGFDGWGGNSTVLTLAADPVVITLRLHPLDGGGSRILVRCFKGQVATDPAGRWFAYFDWTTGLPVLVFRRPDGTVIRTRPFQPFAPQLVAAISAGGRAAPPSGAYTSPWSR